MNKNHRSIWNAEANSLVTVSEKSTTKGKKSKTLKKSKFSLIHLLGSTAVIASSCLSHNAYADPTVCYESPYSDTETVGTTGNDVSYCNLNSYIRKAIFNEGKAIITSTKVNDEVFLKFTLLNPLTTTQDIEEVIALIIHHGQQYSLKN